jgi:hypothetical protein
MVFQVFKISLANSLLVDTWLYIICAIPCGDDVFPSTFSIGSFFYRASQSYQNIFMRAPSYFVHQDISNDYHQSQNRILDQTLWSSKFSIFLWPTTSSLTHGSISFVPSHVAMMCFHPLDPLGPFSIEPPK